MRSFAKIRSRGRLTNLSIATVMLCFVAVLSASWRTNRSAREPFAATQPTTAPIWPLTSVFEESTPGKKQLVYPYSVIPGGAESPQELREALLKDPVVAQHYSDLNLANLHRMTLSAPQLMYVSYRIGNKLFWTKHKLALPKGETMLTDGRSMARTRCGNRVSALPIRPNAFEEPTAEEFNAPVFPPSISTPYLAAYSAPPPALPSGLAPPTAGSHVSSFTPIVPFFPLPGGGGIGGGGNSSTPPPGGGGGGNGGTPPPGGGNGGGGTPPPGAPVGVPEPATMGLLLLGLTSAWMLRRSRKA